MKKLSLKLGNQSLEKMSKDDMKKIKGGGDYDGCESDPVVDCDQYLWFCIDGSTPNPPCTFEACSDQNPMLFDPALSCYQI